MNSPLRALTLTTAGFVLLLTGGCSTLADARRLSWVKKANAQLDCEAAIRRHDLRFYAVNGIAAGIVPGTDQFGTDGALIQSHGIRTIEGTSDSSKLRLNLRASEYARSYNTGLLAYFRAGPRETSYRKRLAGIPTDGTRRDVQRVFPEAGINEGSTTHPTILAIPGEAAERYRLDRDFVLWLQFLPPRCYPLKADGSRAISAAAIDALLFGAGSQPSSKDRLTRWSLDYNPLPRQQP